MRKLQITFYVSRITPHKRICHFCHTCHFLHIVHTDNIRAARDANSNRRGGSFHAFVRGQVKCKADERFSGWPQQYRISQRADLIEAIDQLFKQIESITPLNIVKAAQKYFTPERRTVVVLKGAQS